MKWDDSKTGGFTEQEGFEFPVSHMNIDSVLVSCVISLNLLHKTAWPLSCRVCIIYGDLLWFYGCSLILVAVQHSSYPSCSPLA